MSILAQLIQALTALSLALSSLSAQLPPDMPPDMPPDVVFGGASFGAADTTVRQWNSDTIQRAGKNISTIEQNWKNYKPTANGDFTPIDTTLSALGVSQAPFTFQAPATADLAWTFTNNNLYDPETDTNINESPLTKTTSLIGASAASGTVTGNRIIYAQALPLLDADLILKPETYGFREEIRFNTALQADTDVCFTQSFGNTPRRYKFEVREAETINVEETVRKGFSFRVSRKRAITDKPAYIWSADREKIATIDVTYTDLGGNRFEKCKHVPAAFFTGAVLPVYTDTVSTFNPNTGNPGTNSVDATITNDSTNTNWATIHARTTGDGLDGTGAKVRVSSSATTNQFDTMNRTFYHFYTGATISAGATINDTADTNFQFIASAKTAALGTGAETDLALVESTVVSGNTLVITDWDLVGTTVFGRITQAGITADLATYNTIDMNASGITYIQNNCEGGTAVCKFTASMGMDADNTEPTWGSQLDTGVNIDDTDNSLGGSVKPVLSIDWTAAAAAAGEEFLIIF